MASAWPLWNAWPRKTAKGERSPRETDTGIDRVSVSKDARWSNHLAAPAAGGVLFLIISRDPVVLGEM